tara:strand:- start:170 stop:814 length:645 start_codon:yes stop_codon:yes gene_type:complete
MESSKCLIEIIERNKLSIKDNPFGTTRLWPYSYIELFYNSFCSKLYRSEKSPNILEVNQSNKNNLKVWQYFFETPNIANISLSKIINNKYAFSIKFNLIIIKNKDLSNNKRLLKTLTNLLEPNGIIVLENIEANSIFILKIFQNYFSRFKVSILDFRINRFINDNVILIIEKRKTKIYMIHRFKSICLLIKFLVIELIISLSKIFFNFRKRSKS